MGYAQRQQRLFTPEEYLELERKADFRSEYVDGVIYPMGEWRRDPTTGRMRVMAGASPNHNSISANANGILYAQLRGKPCRPWSLDMRVKVPGLSSYVYPDVLAACPPFEWDDELKDTLLNPVVLIEVLSPSIAEIDRNEKWEHYRQIESLRHYLLVAQDRVWVRHYTRHTANAWLMEDFTDLDDSIPLDTIDASLSLRELYEDVTFDAS
jgi:Uma2 family endonuclease